MAASARRDHHQATFDAAALDPGARFVSHHRLPIPRHIAGCKRSAEDVLQQMSVPDKLANSELIKVFNIMLAQVGASAMDSRMIPNRMVFL